MPHHLSNWLTRDTFDSVIDMGTQAATLKAASERYNTEVGKKLEESHEETASERKEKEAANARADAERKEKEAYRAKNKKLAAKLAALGISADSDSEQEMSNDAQPPSSCFSGSGSANNPAYGGIFSHAPGMPKAEGTPKPSCTEDDDMVIFAEGPRK